MNPEVKPKIKPLNVFVYVVVGMVLGGLLASAVPALLGNARATKWAGLTGVAVGAGAALVVGGKRRFR